MECPPSPVSIMEAFPEALILTRFPQTQTRRGLVKAGHTTTLGRGITNTKTESRPATELQHPSACSVAFCGGREGTSCPRLQASFHGRNSPSSGQALIMIPQPSRGIGTFSTLNDDVEVGIGDAFSRSGAPHLASTGLEVRWGRPVRGLVGLFLGSFLQVRKGKCRKRGKETWQASKSIEL